MPFRCDMRFEKGEKSSAKGGFELGSIASKNTRLTIYTTETDVKQASFLSVDYLNHTLVGGVSVNSLCQQGRLFALSVNRHSVLIMVEIFYYIKICPLKKSLHTLHHL